MASDTEQKPDENGSGGNRATVALVDAKVDTIRVLVEEGFKNTQRQLDAIPNIQAHVYAQESRLVALEGRIHAIEQSDAMQEDRAEKSRAYRIGTLPMILISATALALTAVNIFVLTNPPG